MKELKDCVKYLVYWMVDDEIEGLGRMACVLDDG